MEKWKMISFRKNALLKLKKTIKEHEQEIFAALKEDLGKSAFEAYETEVGIVYSEISFMLKNIDRLAKPKKVRTPLSNFPASSAIFKEPYGRVLIMSPWNYPFQLTMMPLIGALAAGNKVVIKPSNYSPNTSVVIDKIVKETFEHDYVQVVLGGRESNQSLLQEKFDYIFFTGGKAVGRTVMEAAVKNLTPITLELGGKSPCIVDKTANIDLAARRIIWGKLINSGQTCVAPDYVLAEKSVKAKLVVHMMKYIEALYGKEPLASKDYCKIINEKHFDRLLNLIDGEKIVYGGDFDRTSLKISPTILTEVTWESPVMQEEIFGPIIPVIEFDTLDEVREKITERPKPLALYLFAESKAVEKYVISNISFGGGCINDTIMHLANDRLPFGGVGESGMGEYHGRYSFDTFSHKKSVVKKSNLLDIPLRYPPFSEDLWLLKKLLK